MRTTFSVALLMGLALAQPGWNPWGDDPDPVADPSPAPVEDTRPAECAADLETIDDDIEAIEENCAAKSTLTEIFGAFLNLAQGDVENLVEQNRENTIGLAGLQQLDMMLTKAEELPNGTVIDVGMIPDLAARVLGLTAAIGTSDDSTAMPNETIAKKLQRLTTKLEMIKSLMDRIGEAKTACDAISMTQAANGPKLVEIKANEDTDLSIAKAVKDFGTTFGRLDACKDRTDPAGTIDLLIQANEALNVTNKAAFDALKALIDSQVVTNDYWQQNPAEFEFTGISGTLDQFKIADGVPFEFWSYLNARGENNGVLTSISLQNSGAVLAESAKDSMLVQQPPPDRAFPIVYKGIGNGLCNTIDFTSVVSAGQNAIMDMNQHTWGVRTYNTDYPNKTEFSMQPMCM